MSFITPCAYAGKSEWELGVGLSVLDIPFYPGSSQSKTYLVPIPHILYRSENIEIDNGLQATFLKTPKIRIDLSADFGVELVRGGKFNVFGESKKTKCFYSPPGGVNFPPL